MSRIMISPHISYVEATKSTTAIRRGLDNTPNEQELEAMGFVAVEVFEPCRNHFGKPIDVNSFFRQLLVNRAVGSTDGSQHPKGEAIDMDGDRTGVSNKDIFDYIKENLLFDQLIWEYGDNNKPAWVHVSRKQDGNRRQVLQAYRDETGKSKFKLFDLY